MIRYRNLLTESSLIPRFVASGENMSRQFDLQSDTAIHVRDGKPNANIVLVCEHASCFFPERFMGLGLSQADQQSHAAWDPGALPLAEEMAETLGAPLVAGGVSRLIYDLNRPPSAPGAMSSQSERVTVPGNAHLTSAARAERTAQYYEPFKRGLAGVLDNHNDPVLVTVHSFTPVYHGKTRDLDIGILHDSDTRFADTMLATAQEFTDLRVLRNAPYGPEHGVTHTLIEHGVARGLRNVMLEIRNDLITNASEQSAMAQMLSAWIAAALTQQEAA